MADVSSKNLLNITKQFESGDLCISIDNLLTVKLIIEVESVCVGTIYTYPILQV